MIRRCDSKDFATIWSVINDGARAYKGVIPNDCWTEPYMSTEELQRGIDGGVVFWGYEENSELLGVMGLQDVHDVTLIRHAYVRSSGRRHGVETQLLSHLREMSKRPVLIGTWADATWAIRFYEKHGFRTVSPREKDQLLHRYWTVPARQIETSVVLAGSDWRRAHA